MKIKRTNGWWQVSNEGTVIEFRGLDSACEWARIIRCLSVDRQAKVDCRAF